MALNHLHSHFSFKIIDDDIDDYMSNEIQMDIEAADEDAPQIVAVIDDRPPSLRVDEKTNTLLWKPLGENSDVKPEIPKKMSSFQLKKTTLDNKRNILSSKKIPKEFLKKKNEKSSENYHGKDVSTSFKDLETNFKKDSSSSQMKISNDHETNAPQSPLKDRYGEFSHSRKESSDLSPLRTIKQELSSENDHSPPRRRESIHFSNERNQNEYYSRTIKQESTDNDFSPPRRAERHNNDADISPPRRDQRHNNDSDISPPRRQQYNSTPNNNKDISPPKRGSRHNNDSDSTSYSRTRQKDLLNKVDRDISPSRKRQERRYRDHDEDMSPPRKKDASYRHSSPRQDHSKNRMDTYDSDRGKRDISPLRKKRSGEEQALTPPHKSVKDLSPPRKKNITKKNISPLRKINRERSSSPDKRKRDRQTGSRWSDWSPDYDHTKSSGKPEKTMGGKRAGLQSAKELSKEIAALKEKEERVFQNMSEQVSGRNATTIVRGQKPKDPEEEAQKLKKEKELKEKYDRWGKGLKQVENENQKMVDQLYEMSKPLARYADDEDLEKYLKEQEREGDPMLNYIRKKRKKKNIESGLPGIKNIYFYILGNCYMLFF